MAVRTTRCLACLSAVLFSVMVERSQTQRCSSEKMEDTTLNMPAALSKGIRGTDPIHRPSWEACVNACCLEKIAGDQACNYVVFNTNMKGSFPNCYRFYYPAKETCPVKQALGLVTYRIIQGKEIPKPSLNKLPHPVVNRSLGSPQQAAGFDLTKLPGRLDALPRASKEGEIFGPTEHPSEAVDGLSQHPKATRTNSVETFGSSLVHEATSTANTIQRLTPVKGSLATLGSQTSRTVGAGAVVTSAGHVPVSAPYTRRTEVAALQPRKATLPQPSLPSQTRPPHFSSLSSTLPTPTSSASIRESHLSNSGQFSSEGYGPDGNPDMKDAPQLSDRSILLAALFFGVLMFSLAVVLMGGKMLDSLQSQRYTRLDYLINDMYASM